MTKIVFNIIVFISFLSFSKLTLACTESPCGGGTFVSNLSLLNEDNIQIGILDCLEQNSFYATMLMEKVRGDSLMVNDFKMDTDGVKIRIGSVTYELDNRCSFKLKK